MARRDRPSDVGRLRETLSRTIGRFFIGKTERRLALVILVSSMVPLAAALYLATSMFRQASAVWFNPEIGTQLDRGVDVTKDYIKALKDDLRHQTQAIAADPQLREAAKKRNIETLESELDVVFPNFATLVELRVLRGPLESDFPYDAAEVAEKTLARRDRGHPIDQKLERTLDVMLALTDDPDGPQVFATYTVPRKRLDELDAAGNVVSRYHQVEASRSQLYQAYLNAFAALLGVTLVFTVVLGIALARGVTKRINRLGAAINLVAQGDLSVRVPVTGSDELTDLARTFNRMIAEMAQSRARIEFLQRIGAWQDMAQRLAHEIKNPLTPIQLAVQEVHEKYRGEDPKYRGLLDTTLEIVEEEVGTLRRLVGNFSNFARLPTAELREASLSDFMRDCENQLGHLEDPSLGESSSDNDPIPAQNVEIKWTVPKDEITVAIDRQMLRRVIVNLVRNAVQAIRDARVKRTPGGSVEALPGILGHVVVSAHREGEGARIEVEDDGPGIAETMRGRIFDPYFTTKSDGTGLGLAIVKKVVVEHGGEIEADRSVGLGGARFVVHLPGPKILAVTKAAEEERARAKREGVETTGS